MHPLRIVHALPFFDPALRFGGPVAQLRRVCQGLAQRGHQVSVVTTELDIDPELPRERWLAKDGYRIWYSRVNRLGRFAPYYVPGARKPLHESLQDADILHLSLSFTHLNVLGRKAAGKLGVPYIYTPRSCLDPVRLRQKRLSKLLFLALFERKIIRDAAAIHILTETERRQVTRQGGSGERCILIANGTELGKETRWPGGSIFREHFRLHPDGPLILFLGRLHSIKGLDLLIDAFARARGAHSSAQLVIAGPDEGARSLAEQQARKLGVSEVVHFVGGVDGELRLAAYRAADIFALTSYSEGMPNAVLEACAAGTPVLITDRCNLPEVAVCDAGRVVPADSTSVADALVELLADPGRLRTMGVNARQMVHERFDFSTVLDRIEQLYRRLTGTSADSAKRKREIAAVRGA